jgi:hypothetical protein
MSYSNQTPLHQLDSVISETVAHIHDFTKSPTDFTRNRKLNAETTMELSTNNLCIAQKVVNNLSSGIYLSGQIIKH